MSHKPLDMLKKDHQRKRSSTNSHHHRKRLSDVDQIDALDIVPGGGYHHEGPFDATLASRNLNVKYSPVAAVAASNAAALRATPAEKIRDALDRHMPLSGVADVPPGERDGLGRAYHYHETNVMTEEGGNLGQEYRLVSFSDHIGLNTTNFCRVNMLSQLMRILMRISMIIQRVELMLKILALNCAIEERIA
jgi:hypothetical protein